MAFNDVQSTDLLAGMIIDLDSSATFVNVEGSRRFGNSWKLVLEMRALTGVPPHDPLASVARDDYVELELAWYF